jgi:membrane-bound lytic murein transglycosylase D
MSRLLLPVSKAHALQDYIATTDPKFWMPYVEYSVVSGDTLSHLALKFNSKVSVIKRANQLSSNRLKIGQTLFIPREDQLNIYPSKSRYTIVQYRIKPGDTLSEIAKTYATSVQELRRQNNLANNLIRAGDIIDVRTMARASGKADLRKMSYKVRQGDSLYLIAKRFSLSVADITKWNSLNPKRYLQPGQLLTLFIDRKII